MYSYNTSTKLKSFAFVFVIFIFFSYSNTSSAEENIGYKINRDFDLIATDLSLPTKVVLLTIDDGPTKRTKEILEILAKHNVYVIFFVNGIPSSNKRNAGLLESIYKNGHAVGNHTWSHFNLKNMDMEKARKEIDRTTRLITASTGTAPKFFRPPYGVSTPYVRGYVADQGMIFMNWSGSPKDWELDTKDKKVFIKKTLSGLHGGEVILMHEHPWSVSALDEMITEIKARGYTFINPNQIIK